MWWFLRLCCEQVVGALESHVSIHYLDSWPVYPYRTATALLISGSLDLSLHNVTSELHLLLKHIEEVISVTVEGQQMYSPGHRSVQIFICVSLQECHVCSVLIHLAENMVFRGNNDSITHLTSPTIFRWVTVVCGMFPVITGNRTKARAHNVCTCMRTPTHLQHMCASLMKNRSLTDRHLMVYNYRNVSFPQLFFFFFFGSLLSSVNGRQTEQRADVIVAPLTLDSVCVIADIDECELPTLHHCPPSAGCNNTLGSYRCVCHQGYVDADPSNPGTSCEGGTISSSSDFVKCSKSVVLTRAFRIRLPLWLPLSPQQRGPWTTQTCRLAFPQPSTRLAARLPTRWIILRAAPLLTTVRLEIQVLQAPP